MTSESFFHYLRVAGRHPQIAAGSLLHRVGIRAIRLISRRPVILFERHGGIGDIICTFPSVLALRERHPDALFVYSVWRSFKGIVDMGLVADRVVELDWSKEMPKVERSDYDVCYRPWLEDESPLGREQVHLVDDFARTLNVTLKSRQPRLHVPPRLSRSVREKLAPLRRRSKFIFGIHVGPSWPVREWTESEWTKLVAGLRANFDCTVIQFGADAHTAKGFVKAPRISGTEDWVGKLSLEENVAALAQTDLFVGIDSGLLHAAGAVSTPTVGLFGALNPVLRQPPESPTLPVTSAVGCLGCHHRMPRLHWEEGCPHSICCMSELSAGAVLSACGKLLNKTA